MIMKNLLCFSHLDWNFIYQRPQHLLSRFSNNYKIFYFEEPKYGDENKIFKIEEHGITVVKTFVNNLSDHLLLENMTNEFLNTNNISADVLWYYTPMALNFTSKIDSQVVVFDSMDELSAFKFAPRDLYQKEEELFKKADIVFTGGNSLYEAKKHRHHNIHSFPSSIDKEHFLKARAPGDDPDDQRHIGYPRLGFYGVLDERFNIDLLRALSLKKPDWNFIILGPVVKISPEELPKAENIHYLGSKDYSKLPDYIRHWDIAMNMFALNESTKFISPTKTPEYLCAGLPVISTSITDVINPYGKLGLVEIADDAETFINKANVILNEKNNKEWLKNVDAFLADKSWDDTQKQMESLFNKLY